MHNTLATYLAAAAPLYRATQVRELDRYAIEQLGIPGLELMQRAGAAAFAALQRHWPQARAVAVLCGAGNNGGDGYVVATLALRAGWTVSVYALAEPERLKGDALLAYRLFQQAGGVLKPGLPERLDPAAVLVDGLLGTGLDRPVAGAYAQAIAAVNAGASNVLALDIPSGLSADTGMPLGDALRADVTASFIAHKRGLWTGLAAEYCGKRELADLGLSTALHGVLPAEAALLPPALPKLPPRERCAHKGRYGHVLVVGGDSGYSGAARMAAEAAARVGAGLVSVATRAAHAAVLNLGRPELMVHGMENAEQLQPLLAKASVVLIGPGLGQSDWAKALFQAVTASALPLVVDADGLNLLAQAPRRCERWILTPHPGEAARLLGQSNAQAQTDRYGAAAALQAAYGGVTVLKGAGSLVCAGEHTYVCAAGNPGMASGGMGDVLAGCIAGLLAQGLALLPAAAYGTALHGHAGDAAASRGERGLLAGDLLLILRELLNA